MLVRKRVVSDRSGGVEPLKLGKVEVLKLPLTGIGGPYGYRGKTIPLRDFIFINLNNNIGAKNALITPNSYVSNRCWINGF